MFKTGVFNWRVDKLIKPFSLNISPLTLSTTKTMVFKLDAVYDYCLAI